MPLISLDSVTKTFPGGLVGVDAVHLAIEEGEFVTLLGPSGCGKTTTLRMIAGFETPTAGRILFEGHDITAAAPYDRPVNTVFQDYALFPHMSVGDNVGFGLSVAGRPAAERRQRVAEALDLVGLADRIGASVSALSGGQRQRVALARAVINRPRLLLLDEPLSALDANLREQMQTELKALQKTLGTTFLMVTHDQSEALAISDRIVLMHRGRIEQVASPAELYDRPATRFAAGFIGSMNLLAATVENSDAGELYLRGPGFRIALPAGATAHPGDEVLLGWRPEELVLSAAEAKSGKDADTHLVGTASEMFFQGSTLRYRVHLDSGQEISVDVSRQSVTSPLFPPGARVHVKFSSNPRVL